MIAKKWILAATVALTSPATAPGFSGAEEPPEIPWVFTEVASSLGIVGGHANGARATDGDLESMARAFTGGVAAGDFDGDGWTDLYVAGGDLRDCGVLAEGICSPGQNFLYRNLGGNGFVEEAAVRGVALPYSRSSGPVFADIDGDGRLDLFVGGLAGSPPALFRNLGAAFLETAPLAGPSIDATTVGAAFGDYDGDGFLDLATSHWGTFREYASGVRRPNHLWQNLAGLLFRPVGEAAGIGFRDVKPEADTGCDTACMNQLDWTFTPNFADLDGDRYPELLLVGDFGTSRYYRNAGNGGFTDATTDVISDQNGMGSTVGDFDGDGDLDWFVSSIWDPSGPEYGGHWGSTGNRLYRNDGAGSFTDATDEAGVRVGHWGWGSCAADFDNDGNLDIFHVNGFQLGGSVVDFAADPAVLYLGTGGGAFVERAALVGIDDRGQGRGVACFDYDNDGDIDVFLTNAGMGSAAATHRLYRNDLPAGNHHLTVRLRGALPNSEGIGARVLVTAGGRTQMREIRAGSNFASSDPALAHFGLGTETVVDEVRVEWPRPGLGTTVITDVAADQSLTISQ